MCTVLLSSETTMVRFIKQTPRPMYQVHCGQHLIQYIKRNSMKLFTYAEYYDKIKVGDKIHYIENEYHFTFVIKHKFPTGFLGYDSALGSQTFFKHLGRYGTIENHYVQPKEDRWPYKLFYWFK